MKYYIASCMFTAKYSELSQRIRDYIATNPDFSMVRCCVSKWKVREYEEKMPAGALRQA